MIYGLSWFVAAELLAQSGNDAAFAREFS